MICENPILTALLGIFFLITGIILAGFIFFLVGSAICYLKKEDWTIGERLFVGAFTTAFATLIIIILIRGGYEIGIAICNLI